MKVLGLIPARGGSRGIPRKNARSLSGRPLLDYTAQAAFGARGLARVILSTEDPEIAALGRRCGLEVPFLRPAELAADDTPALPVVQHAVRVLEEAGDHFDAVCLLQPTHPLRRSEDIDACVEMLARDGADAVITVLPVPPQFNPHWTYSRCQDGCLHIVTGEWSPIPRRQDLPEAFCREGSVYVTRRDVLMEQNSLYGKLLIGYLLDASRCLNLDTTGDWERAEAILAGPKISVAGR